MKGLRLALLAAIVVTLLSAASCGKDNYTTWCDTDLAPICKYCINCQDGQRVRTDCLNAVANNNTSLCQAFYSEYGYCCVSQ